MGVCASDCYLDTQFLAACHTEDILLGDRHLGIYKPNSTHMKMQIFPTLKMLIVERYGNRAVLFD